MYGRVGKFLFYEYEYSFTLEDYFMCECDIRIAITYIPKNNAYMIFVDFLIIILKLLEM